MANEYIVRHGLISQGNINILNNILTTSTTNGNLRLSANGSGKIALGSLLFPNVDGTSGQVLATDGAGNLAWVTSSGGESNTAAALGTTADGSSIVGAKLGSVLQFRRIKAGANVIVTEEANDVLIGLSGLATVATTGNYNDLLNRPTLATVATTGNYNDLLNKPVAGATNLDGLSDVAITSPAIGQTIRYNGSTFVNASITSTDISGLATVATTGSYTDLSNAPTFGTAATKDVGTAVGQVPVIGANGKLADSIMPALAITDVFVVANAVDRNALSVQTGDVSIQTDNATSWIYDGFAWQELQGSTGSGSVTSVNGQTGVVNLTLSDLTGTLPVSKGGTGQVSFAANNILIGNGTNPINSIAPSTGFLYWNGAAFSWEATAGSSSISSDPTPALGGNLDTSGYSITSTSNVVIDPAVGSFLQISGLDVSGKLQATINDNVTAATNIFSYLAIDNEVIVVEYIIRRGTNTRAGTLIICNDGTNVSHSDAGPEIGDCGITFSTIVSGGNVALQYQSTSSGVGGVMTYSIRKMNA